MDPQRGTLYPSAAAARAAGVESPVEIAGRPADIESVAAAVRSSYEQAGPSEGGQQGRPRLPSPQPGTAVSAGLAAVRAHRLLAWAAPLVLGVALAYVWTVAPGAIALIATGSAVVAVLIAWVVFDYRHLRSRRRWAKLLLEYRDAAVVARDGLAALADRVDALRDALRALHRPWYVDANGARVEHRVYVTVEDPADLPAWHVCVTEVDVARGRYEVCEPDEGEHQVLACYECRQATDDGDPGYLLWPCPTALAERVAAPGTDGDDGPSDVDVDDGAASLHLLALATLVVVAGLAASTLVAPAPAVDGRGILAAAVTTALLLTVRAHARRRAAP